MRPFTIAGLQLELANQNNLETLGYEIDLARKRYPFLDMVVIGELSAYGTDTANAEPLPGPAEQFFRDCAQRNALWLLPGSLFERREGLIHNTAPVIDPGGRIVARYRKMFPFLPYERGVTGGADCVVFDVPGVGRFGVSICYDMWFPETTRTLAWMGAEVILHPTMTNTIDRDVELAIARASAAQNQCYFFDVNSCGRLGYGRSIVAGPGGEVLHEAGTGREVMLIEVDLDYVRRVRRQGWNRLGQVLKSFRDCRASFPVYADGARASPALQALGELEMPQPERPHLD